MIPGRQYTPEDLLKIALRRKWLVVPPLVAGALAAAVLLQFLPNKYKSETLILVVPQRVPESYVQSTVTTRIEDRLQSLRQQILSRTRLERIILDYDLYAPQRASAPMEDIVGLMRRQIDVQLVRGDAFAISFISESPETAQRVTERLASLVIDENLKDREIVAEGTSEFIETQLEEARVRLVEHEKKLEAYRRAHIGELPTQAQANMQAVANLQANVQGLSDSIARDRDRLFIVEREITDMPARIEAGAVQPMPGAAPATDADGLPVASPSERLAAARTQLRVMETRLKPEHPDVIRMKGIIRDLEAKAAEERKPDAPKPAGPSLAAIREAQLRDERAQLNRQISQKDAQLNELRGQIGTYQARLDAMPTRETELVALTRDYDTLQGVYTDLLAKRENSKVAANLERRQIGEQFKILDPAFRPETAFSPNRRFIALAGVAGGLALGVAIIVLMELREKTYRSDTDIQQSLKLPVLAMIPRMPNAEERARRRRLMVWGTSAAVVMLAVMAVVAMTWLR